MSRSSVSRRVSGNPKKALVQAAAKNVKKEEDEEDEEVRFGVQGVCRKRVFTGSRAHGGVLASVPARSARHLR